MSAPSQYLEPVSSDAPCGDATSVGNLWQLDGLFTPSGADLLNWKPDWKEVTKVAERLLPNCKHVKLALIFGGMAMQKEGLGGFRDGLSLLLGWLERYWDHLYPQLDKELADPYEQMLERINELRNLTNQGIGGISVLAWLYGTTICRSRSFGNLSLRAVAIVAGSVKPVEGEAVPAAGDTPMTAAQLDAAFREFQEAEPDELAAQIQAVKESQEILGKLDAFISEKAGSRARSRPGPIEPGAGVAGEMPGLAGRGGGGGGRGGPCGRRGAASGGAAAGGKISSRGEALKSIAAICEYYRRYEPSSPVPLLLQRAGRLIEMDFLQIVEDLSIEGGDQARRLLGGGQKGAGRKREILKKLLAIDNSCCQSMVYRI